MKSIRNFVFKIIVIRPPHIGDYLLEDKFKEGYKQTTGVGFFTKNVKYEEDKVVKLQMWDINTTRFKHIRIPSFRNASGTLIFFDLTNRKAFEEAKDFYMQIKEVNGQLPFLLVGDKVNFNQVEYTVDHTTITGEAHAFTKKEGGMYIEIMPGDASILEKPLYELTGRIIKFYLLKKP
jgi:hypothetical protein